jgi:acyl-coenzyme A synthetase/AMP-(fatty) acid ligase
VAYVVTEPGDVSPGLPGQLVSRCRQVLSSHQQPASVIVVDALPTGPTGKPDRRALRTAAAAAAAAQDRGPAATLRGKQDSAEPATSPH